MTLTTKNYLEVIHAELAADPELAELVEIELFNSDLAMKVYEARTRAKLTQKQLADLAGTQQSVISRIEDADYHGRSLTLLRRIAKALRLKLRVEFCADDAPKGRRSQPKNLVSQTK
jgi:ribosome-binding protein aMBF1 (putative translation factor)